LFAAVTTVPNAKVEVLGPDEIRVSWDPVYQDMVAAGILLGFKIYYDSEGEMRRTIILVEDVTEHVIPALSECPALLSSDLVFDVTVAIAVPSVRPSVCLSR